MAAPPKNENRIASFWHSALLSAKDARLIEIATRKIGKNKLGILPNKRGETLSDFHKKPTTSKIPSHRIPPLQQLAKSI
jgi:hypothetical protein